MKTIIIGAVNLFFFTLVFLQSVNGQIQLEQNEVIIDSTNNWDLITIKPYHEDSILTLNRATLKSDGTIEVSYNKMKEIPANMVILICYIEPGNPDYQSTTSFSLNNEDQGYKVLKDKIVIAKNKKELPVKLIYSIFCVFKSEWNNNDTQRYKAVSNFVSFRIDPT